MSTVDSHRARWLSRNVVWIGVVSLLTDASSEMIAPLLPVFVVGTLGGGALAVGLIEGAADATASVLKLVSGIWADRARRNRPFVIAGYALASVSRPLVALAAAPWHVLVVRVADRVGKGLRSSPRDALLAASVPAAVRGRAFGFHRAMDHAGAVIGPLLALALLAWWTDDLRTIFLLAAVPGALAVLAVSLGVREATATRSGGTESPRPARAAPPSRARLVGFLLPLALFTLGNASDAFLLLLASRGPLEVLPLLWMALHVVKSLSSLLGGALADRVGARDAIVLGWLVYVVVYVGFAFAESATAIWVLFVVYGLHHGLSEAPERALVSALVPASRRGGGFGWYHLTVGVLSLAASVSFGALWETWSSRVAFLTAAGLALVATGTLIATVPRRALEELTV